MDGCSLQEETQAASAPSLKRLKKLKTNTPARTEDLCYKICWDLRDIFPDFDVFMLTSLKSFLKECSH